MTDEKILGTLSEGDVVQLNGQKYTVDDIRYDESRGMQVTFLTPDAVKRKQEREDRGAPCRISFHASGRRTQL
jgi:hypothetical protein